MKNNFDANLSPGPYPWPKLRSVYALYNIICFVLQVQQQYKLPSLYLLDSIVKNVGGDYLHLVAQIMEETFTCVFEKVCF